jgi:hypothetical protein
MQSNFYSPTSSSLLGRLGGAYAPPSAAEMEEQGVNLAEMNKLLLQKVEELTLYSIELEKARRLVRIEALLIKGNDE